MTQRRTFIKELAAIGVLYPFASEERNRRLIKIDTGKKIVCIGGHPDDPESGCGGTLLLHVKAGNKVNIVYLTKGEAGIDGKSHAEAAAIRTKETKAAAALIGAETNFAGQIDGDTIFSQSEIKKLLDILQPLQPDIIYTHWPLDTHPDHQVASLLTLQCWLRLDRKPELYFFEVDSGAQTMQFAPTDYVDITAVAEQKKKALFQHESQEPGHIYDDHHHVMQLFRGREIGVKEAEAFVRMSSQYEK